MNTLDIPKATASFIETSLDFYFSSFILIYKSSVAALGTDLENFLGLKSCSGAFGCAGGHSVHREGPLLL